MNFYLFLFSVVSASKNPTDITFGRVEIEDNTFWNRSIETSFSTTPASSPALELTTHPIIRAQPMSPPVFRVPPTLLPVLRILPTSPPVLYVCYLHHLRCFAYHQPSLQRLLFHLQLQRHHKLGSLKIVLQVCSLSATLVK